MTDISKTDSLDHRAQANVAHLNKIRSEASIDISRYKRHQQDIFKISDTSKLEKIGNLLEVGKLFNEVKEIDLHKDGFVSYGFSVEHTEKNEIPGYILLKVTKISNDASQSVLQNLRVGDFILKIDEKVVCTVRSTTWSGSYT